MSDTGKQSPLGVNVLGSLLNDQGFYINPTAASYFGESKENAQYSPGKIVNDTCLKWLTYAVNDAFNRGLVDNTTYDNMLNIGQSRIPALGNSPPPTYVVNDPSGVWGGQATSGYAIPGDGTVPPVDPSITYPGQGQEAKWRPYSTSNPNKSVTQWGWIRCLALQAWNEFNWNNNSVVAYPKYKDFVNSIMSSDTFVNYTNAAILASHNSKEFLKGTYSNMDDLISADISGVSLSSRAFGEDLINLGKALDFTTLRTFGLPSNLLRTLKTNNALTQSLNLSLISTGLSQQEIDLIINDFNTSVSLEQEQKIYSAYLIITGSDLVDILVPLNCRTKGLTTLADLLNVKNMFPISYSTLTVPIYNISPGPTNSKTYYLLFINGALNPQLISPPVVAQVGMQIPPTPPPVVEVEPMVAIMEKAIIEKVVAGESIAPVLETYMPAMETGETKISFKGGGGGCVALESYVPLVEGRKHNDKPVTQAWQLESGFNILLADNKLDISTGNIAKILVDKQPCVKIKTSDGASLVCSHSARILTKENGYMDATQLFGKRVPVLRYNRTYNEGATIMHPTVFWDEIVSITDVGVKYVRVIDTGDNAFWAGEKQGSYILHHNVRISDEFKYDKN